MNRRRIWVYAASAVVVLALAWMVFAPKGSKGKPRTAAVERGRIVATVSATGTINPVVQVEVGSQISGTIEKLHADYNDKVTKGEVLAELEPSLLKTAVVQAQANVVHAVAGVTDAARTLRRSRQLFQQNLAAQVDTESAETAWQQRVSELKQAQAALGTAQVNLDHATIRSPISGVVIARAVDVGQTVAASLSAPTLFTLAQDLSRMQVETKIDESDVGRIRQGLRSTFTVDAYPNDTFEGTVSQVRLEPITTENVVTYTTIIDVPNPDNKLRPGMTANVTIITDTRQDALRVPNAALRFRPTDVSMVEGGMLPGRDNALASAGDSSSRRGGSGGVADGPSSGGTTGRGAAGAGGAGGGGDWRQRMASGDTTGMGARRARWMAKGGSGGGGNGGGGAGGAGGWGGMRKSSGSQTVYVLLPDKKMKPITVRTGITDGAFTEIVSGELKEGDTIITGMDGTSVAQSNTSTPPGFGGMRGGRGGVR